MRPADEVPTAARIHGRPDTYKPEPAICQEERKGLFQAPTNVVAPPPSGADQPTPSEPPARAVTLSRAWQCNHTHIVPNRGKILFPKTFADGVVYDVVITGTIRFSYRKCDGSDHPDMIVRGRADAFYLTTNFDDGDTGAFTERHDWLRINGDHVRSEQLFDKNGMRDPCALKADRGDHTYRLRIEGAGDLLDMAFEGGAGCADSFISSGCFTVSVTAWVPDQQAPPDGAHALLAHWGLE